MVAIVSSASAFVNVKSEQWKPSPRRCGCKSDPALVVPSAATVASRHGSPVYRVKIRSDRKGKRKRHSRTPFANIRRSVVVFQPLYALLTLIALGDAGASLFPHDPGKRYPHCL